MVVWDHAPQGSVCCELCDAEASLYCQADDAFLCPKCDKKVHAANFLAQRHIRCLLCRTSVEVRLPTIVSKKERNQSDSNVEPKEQLFLFL